MFSENKENTETFPPETSWLGPFVDDPYLFRISADQVIRRCVYDKKPIDIHGCLMDPPWDFRIAPDYEDSRARGFVLRSLELQSLARL
ncbi:hypothetical protein Tco_0546816 [Tanacetum coccineum]